MSLFSKWLAAGLISTSLIFSGGFADAKPKHTKAHKTQVKHKKTGKKHAKKSAKSHKKSEGYAKASGYMKRSPASATPHKKKKARKVRRT
ncbi:hypothetical protein D3C72_1215680 [compost metagenome]